MTFEIGRSRIQPALSRDDSAGAVPVDSSDAIPASPPPEVLAEVDAAWERVARLAAENRELHFARDPSGRVVIEVRTLDGDVLSTIPPSRALGIMGGEPL